MNKKLLSLKLGYYHYSVWKVDRPFWRRFMWSLCEIIDGIVGLVLSPFPISAGGFTSNFAILDGKFLMKEKYGKDKKC